MIGGIVTGCIIGAIIIVVIVLVICQKVKAGKRGGAIVRPTATTTTIVQPPGRFK